MIHINKTTLQEQNEFTQERIESRAWLRISHRIIDKGD